jgi:hypothetical protein
VRIHLGIGADALDRHVSLEAGVEGKSGRARLLDLPIAEIGPRGEPWR